MRTATTRLPTIDHLRAVAILLVVVYHAGPLSFRIPPHDPDGFLRLADLRGLGFAWLGVLPFHFGFVGVHAFFVISGFCIHLRGARRRFDPAVRTLDVKTFFLKRYLRIFPPYWIALLAFGVIVPVALRALGRAAEPAGAADLVLHATMLHGLSPTRIFSINPAFWSLATEEQFYLVYPLLGVALARAGAARVLVGALVLSLSFRAAVLAIVPPADSFLIDRVWLHGFFVPRWFDWILGCALAEAAVDPRAPLAGRARPLGLLAAALLLLGMACRVHVVVDKLLADACFSAGFAALLGALLAARATAAGGRERSEGHGPAEQRRPADERSPADAAAPAPSRPRRAASSALATLGRRSYGVYLVHQPILDGDYLPLWLRLPLAAVASALFCLGCERPFERLAQRIGAAPSPVATGRDAAAAP